MLIDANVLLCAVIVADWLDADIAWIPTPKSRPAQVLGQLIATHRIAGNLIPDAHLAALAIEHGLTVTPTTPISPLPRGDLDRSPPGVGDAPSDPRRIPPTRPATRGRQ